MASERWVRIRDKLEIGAQLITEFITEAKLMNLKEGAPLYLIASKIRHKQNFEWNIAGHPIVLICDKYDGNGGRINTSGVHGQNGTHGTPGKDGASNNPSKKTAGGHGTSGTNGTNGTSASPITLIAREAFNVSLHANGGKAGHGGNGGDGGDGTSIITPTDPRGHPEEEITEGGNGGNGGNAGKAGNGANITIKTLKMGNPSPSNAFTTSAKAGAAGIGGKRGIGGMSGKSRRAAKKQTQAPSGKVGVSTPAGSNGVITQTEHPPEAWWAQAAAALPAPVLQEWADYRERVGEYLFRSYVAAKPDTKQSRDFAKAEFDAVLGLRPGSPQASRLKGYLNLGLTPIGLPYDYDLRPKVSLFEQFIVDYNPHRESLFDKALPVLLKAGEANQQRAILGVQADFYASHVAVAEADLQMTEIDAAKAEQRLDYAKGRLQALQDKLNKLAEARKNAPISFGDYVTIIGEVVVAVASIAGAVVSGGTTLVAFVGAVGALANSAAALQKVGYLVDASDLTDPKLTPEGSKMIGDIKSAVQKTKEFIDAAKAIYELINAAVEDEPDAPEPQVLAEQVQAAFDVAMARFDVERGALAKQGAQQKLQAYRAGSDALAALETTLSADAKALTKAAQLLLKQFQLYNDLFIRYHFYVNRAFDLYTLPTEPRTPATLFNFGYVHPDIQANAFAALERKESSATQLITSLLGKYTESLKGVLPVETRDQYIHYTQQLDSVATLWRITSPAVLNALRTNGVATFQTSFSDLDDDFGPRTELKLQQLRVALLGAKAKSGDQNLQFVEVWVTHTGSALNRRHGDKSVVPVTGPSLADALNATLTPIDLDDFESTGADLSEEPRAWGRSPITTWQIRITAKTAAQLDLSGLSELQFGVKYAFYDPAQAAKKKASGI
jgi:hypothetical protein